MEQRLLAPLRTGPLAKRLILFFGQNEICGEKSDFEVYLPEA
jgi:hypothetical protein